MTGNPWEKRAAKPPTLAELTAEIEERMRFMEDDLRKRGKYFVSGAEQEFFAQDEKGKPFPIVPIALQIRLRERLGKESHIQRIYQDGADNLGKYEIVFGTPQKHFRSSYSSIEIAKQIRECRQLLSDGQFAGTTAPKISFAATKDHDQKATAGLHFSSSVYDVDGNNLFYDKDIDAEPDRETLPFSDLAKDTSRYLLALQKDGLALYTSSRNSYDRFHKHDQSPAVFDIQEDKRNNSVALRDSIGFEACKPELCRVEDRLADANTSPYFVALANLGATWLAATTRTRDVPNPSVEALPRFPTGYALQRFEKSDYWKTIAGDELHADIIAYCKALQQSHVVAKS